MGAQYDICRSRAIPFWVIVIMADQQTLLIPADRARIEMRVVNSRFIASAGPTATVEAARTFIATVRAEMPDATHHVYAYIIGHGATTTLGMSDDGEPSGTAGRPVLSVLRGSGLGDITVVVTRYFGGTLLGTGGLVHAYGDAVKQILAVLPRREKIERQLVMVVLSYAEYEQARRVATAHAGEIVEEIFAVDVTLRMLLPVTQVEPFVAAIHKLTAGQARVTKSQ